MKRHGRKRKTSKNISGERIKRKRNEFGHRPVVSDSEDSDIKERDQIIDEDKWKNEDDMTNGNSEESIDAADVRDKTSTDKDKDETERNTNPNCVIKQKAMDNYFRKRTMAPSGEHMYSPIVITENDISLDIDQDGIEMVHVPYQPPEVVNLESGDESDHESEGISVKPEPLDGSADQATDIQDDNSCRTAVDLREEAVPIATHILNTGSDNIQQEQTAAITTEKDDDKIPVTEVETDNNNDCNDSSKEIDINEMGAVNIENSGTVAGVDSDNDLDCVLIKENEELMKGAQTEAGHETVKPTDARVDLDFRKRTMAASGEHMYSPIVITENDTSLDIDQDGIEMMHFPYQPPEVVNLESGDENDHESEGNSVKPEPLDGSADQATNIQDDKSCNNALDLREEAVPNATHTLNTSSDVQQEPTAAITRKKDDDKTPVTEVETDNNNDSNGSSKEIDINEMESVNTEISGTVADVDSDNDLDCVIIEENEELKKGAQLKAGHEIVKQTDVRGGLELNKIDKKFVENGTEFERSNENENIGSEEQGRDEVVSKDKEGMVKRPTSCTESIFKCDHCEVRCNDEKSMREHLDTAVHYAASKYIVDNTGGLKLMKNVVITNMKAKFKTTVMKCPVAACPAIFPQMNQCVDHYNKKHWKKGRPKSLYGLIDIVKEEEYSISLKHSMLCQNAESFWTLDKLKRHKKNEGHFPFDLTEQRIIFLCLYCGKHFKLLDRLIEHLRVHIDVIDDIFNIRIFKYDKLYNMRTLCFPTTSRS
ncbi:uncharacterized protein LOC123535581 [Mercenaria mercenaria]|uniref:uncharacterized protein LOC123535581 n=1 Tax=Mercenaria mercenaria TaxID=6596 RepID=UPI00234EC737|nr:uncharacterized protein LOC123535581 [Mercenaria mercenaria]